jgi:uncharacterized Zn finger protein (UPF0148 family)
MNPDKEIYCPTCEFLGAKVELDSEIAEYVFAWVCPSCDNVVSAQEPKEEENDRN